MISQILLAMCLEDEVVYDLMHKGIDEPAESDIAKSVAANVERRSMRLADLSAALKSISGSHFGWLHNLQANALPYGK